MKKSKLLVLSLLSAMVLTGCGGKADFKDNTVKEELSDAETAIIALQMREVLKEKLSGYTLKSTFTRNTDLEESTQTVEEKVTIYDNYYVHAESTAKVEDKKNGLIIKNETKTTGDAFRLNDDLIAQYQINEKGEVSYYFDEGKGEDVYEVALDGFFQGMQNMQGYKDSKGNIVFIGNNYDETYNPVVYGTDTKIIHSITKTQSKVELDKEYKVKSYYAYQSVETNQDPDTLEIKDKESMISEMKASADIYYKTRKNNDSGFTGLRDEILSKYFFVTGSSLKAKVGDDDVAINSQTVELKRLGFAKYEYTKYVVFQVGKDPLSENKAIKFYLEGDVGKIGSEEAPTTITVNIVEINLAGKVDFTVSQQVKLLMKYTVELSTDKAVHNVSDVVFYLA